MIARRNQCGTARQRVGETRCMGGSGAPSDTGHKFQLAGHSSTRHGHAVDAVCPVTGGGFVPRAFHRVARVVSSHVVEPRCREGTRRAVCNLPCGQLAVKFSRTSPVGCARRLPEHVRRQTADALKGQLTTSVVALSHEQTCSNPGVSLEQVPFASGARSV